MVSPSDFLTIPLDDWVNFFVKDWLVPNFRPAFRAAQVPITMVLNELDEFFVSRSIVGDLGPGTTRQHRIADRCGSGSRHGSTVLSAHPVRSFRRPTAETRQRPTSECPGERPTVGNMPSARRSPGRWDEPCPHPRNASPATPD